MRHGLIALAAFLFLTPVQAETPQFGGDRQLSRYEYGDPRRAIWNADVATDGDGYLAVWSDARQGGFDSAVWAARVAADGTLLDKTGMMLAPVGYHVEVVWTGESYVVAWRTTQGVWITRVGRDGVVSGTRLIIEAIGGPDIGLATTGQSILVAMGGGPFAVLDLDLSVRARGELASTPGPLNTLSVTASANQYFAASVLEAGFVVTQTISQSGIAGAPMRIEESQGARMVSAASDGQSFFVLWTDEESELQGLRITSDNQITSAARTFAAEGPVTGENARVVQSPHVMWSGGEYLATFFIGGGTYLPQDAHALLISQSGEASSAPRRFGFASGLDHANIAAKGNGSGAVIWTDGARRVNLGLYDANSIASRERFHKVVSVANAARFQSEPEVIAVDRVPVAAWIERSDDSGDVRIARIGDTPVIVDTIDAARVWLASDGDLIAVVWLTETLPAEYRLRRYTRTLEPVDATFRRVAVQGNLDSVAAANGIITMTSTSGGGLFFTRIVPANGFTTESRQLSSDDASGSRIAWDGTRFVIAWHRLVFEEGPFAIPVGAAINAAHVSLEGELLRLSEVYRVPRGGIYALRLASRDGTSVIAWEEGLEEPGPGEPDGIATYAARFDGSPLTRRFLLQDPDIFSSRLQDIEIHRDGRVDVFWLRWSHARSEASLRVMRLSAELVALGEPYVSEPFVTARPRNMFDSEWRPDMAATIVGNQALMLYVRRDDSRDAGSVARLFVRTELPQTGRRRAVR